MSLVCLEPSSWLWSYSRGILVFQDRVIIAKEAKRIQEFSRLQKDFFSSLQFPSALYVIIMLLKKTDSDDVIALKRLLNPLRITFSTSKERFEFIALLEMEGISSCLLSIFSSEHAESMYIFDDHVHVNQKWFRSEIEETHLGMTMTMTQKIRHCIWRQAVIFMQKTLWSHDQNFILLLMPFYIRCYFLMKRYT